MARSGLISGLKRRGGFGFIPKKALTREHMFLKNLDLKGKTVYDIGGYEGLLTMFFAREVGATGQVITFEPHPRNYQLILDHIKLNGFTNVNVIPVGLGCKQETLKFVVGSNLARGTADPYKQEQLLKQGQATVLQIKVDSLDNQVIANNLPGPDFVKIDVEGLELDVLRGMAETIQQYQPTMHIELHGIHEQEIAELLLAHGYHIYQVEDDVEITYQNFDKIHGHLYAYETIPLTMIPQTTLQRPGWMNHEVTHAL